MEYGDTVYSSGDCGGDDEQMDSGNTSLTASVNEQLVATTTQQTEVYNNLQENQDRVLRRQELQNKNIEGPENMVQDNPARVGDRVSSSIECHSTCSWECSEEMATCAPDTECMGLCVCEQECQEYRLLEEIKPMRVCNTAPLPQCSCSSQQPNCQNCSRQPICQCMKYALHCCGCGVRLCADDGPLVPYPPDLRQAIAEASTSRPIVFHPASFERHVSPTANNRCDLAEACIPNTQHMSPVALSSSSGPSNSISLFSEQSLDVASITERVSDNYDSMSIAGATAESQMERINGTALKSDENNSLNIISPPPPPPPPPPMQHHTSPPNREGEHGNINLTSPLTLLKVMSCQDGGDQDTQLHEAARAAQPDTLRKLLKNHKFVKNINSRVVPFMSTPLREAVVGKLTTIPYW